MRVECMPLMAFATMVARRIKATVALPLVNLGPIATIVGHAQCPKNLKA
jgi:hypothetical protein